MSKEYKVVMQDLDKFFNLYLPRRLFNLVISSTYFTINNHEILTFKSENKTYEVTIKEIQ